MEESSFIVGECLAVVVAAAVIFTQKGTTHISTAYRVLLIPLLASVLFALVARTGISIAASTSLLVFASELLSMLLLYVVAVYSSSKELPPAPVYAACMIPLYASMWLGQFVFALAFSDSVSETSIQVSFAVVALLLGSAVLAVPRKAKAKEGKASESRAFQSETSISDEQPEPNLFSVEGLQECLGKAGLAEPLTYRECEVAFRILHGNSVSAVSKKLFVSDNTTRSHIKNIYRKTGAHSRQEFVDFVDHVIQKNQT